MTARHWITLYCPCGGDWIEFNSEPPADIKCRRCSKRAELWSTKAPHYTREEQVDAAETASLPFRLSAEQWATRLCDEADRLREKPKRTHIQVCPDCGHMFGHQCHNPGDLTCPNCGDMWDHECGSTEPEGVWVRPGEKVSTTDPAFAQRALFVHPDQSHQKRDGNDNIHCYLDSGAEIFYHPSSLTLSAQPVLGVRVEEFSDDEVREAIKRTWYGATMDQTPATFVADDILREIREARP